MLSVYYFFSHVSLQIIALPLWWYTRGLNKIIQLLADWQIAEWRRLGLFVWLRNLFTPMFHDYTIIGRGLSFVLRLIIIVFRLIALVVKFAFKIALVALWIALPLVVLFGFITSIIGVR